MSHRPPKPEDLIDLPTEEELNRLQVTTLQYYLHETNPANGLVRDKTDPKAPCSIAAVGLALATIPVVVERGVISREFAPEVALRKLRFFRDSPQGPEPDATGYRGFYYHFLDMDTGARFRDVELSTIDTTLLAAGALACQSYFDREDPVETRIRADADTLYRRIEWDWASPRPPGVSMGWTPEEGFHKWNWHGYDEAMILYILALGSPTHPVEPAAWREWTKTYKWGTYYGEEHVNFSPLFGHQYSHVWIDYRGIRDAYMRMRGIDYFENSRRATYSQRAYAAANPGGFAGYGPDVWGLTASDGPLDGERTVRGRPRKFQGYAARGASLLHVIDDGTLSPTAAASSLPFAPEIALPAIRTMTARWGAHVRNPYGFLDAFNPTLDDPAIDSPQGTIVDGVGWFDRDQLGIDQGPIVAMLENYRSELVWKTMRKNPYIIAGLRRAGFTGGWLETAR